MAKREEVNNQKELNSEKRKELSLEQQLIDLLAERRGIDSEILTDNENIANVIQDQVKNMSFEVIQRNKIRALSSSIAKIASDSYSITKDQLGLTKTNVDIANKQATIAKNVILLEQQKKQLLEAIEDGTASNSQLNRDIATSIDDQVKSAKKLSNDLNDVAAKSKEISDNFGVKTFGGLGDIAKAIPGLNKFSGPFEEAAEASRGMAVNIQDAANSGGKGLTKEKIKQMGLEKDLGNLSGRAAAQRLKGMGGMQKGMIAMKAGFKALGPMIKKAFGPVGLIIEAVQAFLTIDKASGETAKAMGISAKEARAMNAEMADAAAMSGDLLVSSQDVVKANMQLNKLMGTSVKFSGEFAAEFASIQERTGLSEHAMGVFAEKALIAGTSIEDQLQKVTAVTMELSAQTGIMLNAKDIQEGIGEMSATQMLNNRMNTKEMAKQVFQAKLLGLSQSQLESVQGSLLEFESSIAAEMEAELLTGKQLNLEGARQAALMGDQAALAAELRKEVGTAAEFGKMNVIQQEAMAKAFGMSREDMAAMLIEQEKLEAVKAAGFASASEAQEMYNKALEEGNLTEEKKKKLQEAGLLAQFESATAQDKMNAAMDKFSDLFIQLVDPLMPIIDALMAVLDPIFAILSPILKLIGDLVGLIMNQLMPAFDGVEKIMGGVSKVITGIFTLDFGMILDGFKSVAAGAIGLILSPFQAVTNLVVGVINGVISGLNYIPGVDIGELETPDLAGLVTGFVGLETGGIVTQPTAALIGEGDEPEAVLPLSKLSSMLPDLSGMAGGALDIMTAPARGLASGIGSIAGGVSDFVGGLFGGDEAEVGNAEIIAELRAIKIAIEKGGDVYIDGAKAGKSMALATSKIG